ncbi:MAG: 4-(cytidine 5'-diphospho)-2-C-methyl-D-erythritol kinase [Clostridia bacterium]|nr:4-(cytidine 5'-diphospho)-2-C-methyl-D-erythritol kinase [Clostridia bacterium]
MKLKANAKINLTLDVVGKRDDGYHLIDSVFQSISLCDTICIEKSDKLVVRCTNNTIDSDSNIAYKAAQSFFEYTQISGGAFISIEKNIPLVSGMGGGSADAAAVIIALDKLYDTNLDIKSLCEIGLAVGADVPFCLIGGTMRVGGIGEKMEKLPDMPDCSILVIKHGQKLSTADMYKKIDDSPIQIHTTPFMVDSIVSGDLSSVCKNVSNAFASVCDNTQFVNDIKTTNPLGVSLTGSGPTVFAIYKDDKAATSALKLLADKGYNPIVTKPVNQGIIFE